MNYYPDSIFQIKLGSSTVDGRPWNSACIRQCYGFESDRCLIIIFEALVGQFPELIYLKTSNCKSFDSKVSSVFIVADLVWSSVTSHTPDDENVPVHRIPSWSRLPLLERVGIDQSFYLKCLCARKITMHECYAITSMSEILNFRPKSYIWFIT